MGGVAKAVGGAVGGGKNSKPPDSAMREAQVYKDLRDPVFQSIQDARRLYEQGYAVPETNRRQWQGVEAVEDWADKFGGSIDEPLEYATWLSGGKGVGDAPGQEYLQGVYQNGAPTAGYGTQEQILKNLMAGNGAGYGSMENILQQTMGKTGNLDYLQSAAAGDYLRGNPHLDAVLGGIQRGTTQNYQSAIGSLEGGMSRTGGGGGSVESQLRARENEGLARALSENEANVRYGDYSAERGRQQQAGLALPGAYATDMATKMGAAGQLGDMEARRIGMQQGAAGQLNQMSYQKLMAEMQAAQQAGSGYRSDIAQALQAGGLMPSLGQAGFTPGHELWGMGEATRQAGQQQANAGWENLNQYLQSLRGVTGLMGTGTGTTDRGPSTGQQVAQTGLSLAAMYAMSDRRAKRDVELVGTTEVAGSELPLYRWRYAWSDQQHIGPMAQDVQAVAPELVREIDGLLCIPAHLVRLAPANMEARHA